MPGDLDRSTGSRLSNQIKRPWEDRKRKRKRMRNEKTDRYIPPHHEVMRSLRQILVTEHRDIQ